MKRYTLILVAISLLLVLVARNLGDEFSTTKIVLWVLWILTLPLIAYVATPPGTSGRIAFGSSLIAIAGVVFKFLHLAWADELLIVGMAGVVVVYAVMWIRSSSEA